MTTPARPGSGSARGPAAATAVLGTAVLLAGLAWKSTHLSTLADQYLRWGYSDIPPLFHAERLDVGAVPYLDHAVEYPVLTGLQMWAAGVPATDGRSFLWWTAPILVASLVATVWMLVDEVGWRRALVLAAAPTLLVSGAVNWDLPSVALATAGIIAHRRGRDGWAGTWLGLGTAAKLWPGMALLALVPAAWRWRGRRAGLVTAGAAAGAWLAVNLPVALAAPSGWWRFVELNRERGLDWDPLLAVAGRVLGWAPAVGTVNTLSAVAVVAGLVAVLSATVRRTTPDRWHHAILPLVAWFLLANKVWSPQFSLWLLPLFALTFPGWRWVLAFGAADVAVTITRFRHLGLHVGDPATAAEAWSSTPFDVALVVRAVVLVGAVWVGWRRATAPSPGSLSRST
jgi:uncharacterized membrane protein